MLYGALSINYCMHAFCDWPVLHNHYLFTNLTLLRCCIMLLQDARVKGIITLMCQLTCIISKLIVFSSFMHLCIWRLLGMDDYCEASISRLSQLLNLLYLYCKMSNCLHSKFYDSKVPIITILHDYCLS